MPWDIYIPPVKKVEDPAPLPSIVEAPKPGRKKKSGKEE